MFSLLLTDGETENPADELRYLFAVKMTQSRAMIDEGHRRSVARTHRGLIVQREAPPHARQLTRSLTTGKVAPFYSGDQP